ncbi:UNVERIFIED_CONTAM: putative protein phosphatase 2C 35 [Sesamum calycinum]|uniref:protein-serine/threonine phosphatase n=1 Tax=Sesamum calycinum TaxID=2727403 RepID=A0AAW2R8Q9_9LAMI
MLDLEEPLLGKCCRKYAPSSRSDKKEELGLYSSQNAHIIANTSLDVVDVPAHNFRLTYSVLSQRGYYPETPDKENQDSYCVRTNIQGNPNVHFFGVFDGHGLSGTHCSTFVKDRLVEILSTDAALLDDPVKAYSNAFLATNEELHNSGIDDSMSGTTAITALVIGDKLYVANVGDSRAVLAVKEGNRVLAQDLSYDQTPFRKDECERVKLCGARVLSVDQVEGLKDPRIQSWGDEETEGSDPPRLWVQNGMYPGTAFTRSVGDNMAEKIGVVADPEVSTVQLTSSHPFFVVASDGVFEFLPSQTVVDMVNKYADPRDACSAIAGEAYNLWLEHENRTDDITIIIVRIKDLSHGHVFPYLELAKNLSTHNFDIFFCSTALNLSSISDVLAHTSSSVSIQLVELHLPSSSELPPCHHTTKNAPPHLLSKLHGLQTWAAKIASSLGIPAVHFSTSGAAAYSFYFHSFMAATSAFPYEDIYVRDYERKAYEAMVFSDLGVKKNDLDSAIGHFTLSCDVVLMKTCRAIEGKYMDYLSALCKKKLVPVGPLVTTYTC